MFPIASPRGRPERCNRSAVLLFFEGNDLLEHLRENILRVARALEAEASVMGASAHLLAIGRT